MFISSRRHRRAEREEGSETGADGQQPGEQPATPPTYEEAPVSNRSRRGGGLPRAPEDEERRATRTRSWKPRRKDGTEQAGGGITPHFRRGWGQVMPTLTRRSIGSMSSTLTAIPRTTSGGCVRSSRPGAGGGRAPRQAAGGRRSTRPRQLRIRSDRRAGERDSFATEESGDQTVANRRSVSEGSMFGPSCRS